MHRSNEQGAVQLSQDGVRGLLLQLHSTSMSHSAKEGAEGMMSLGITVECCSIALAAFI